VLKDSYTRRFKKEFLLMKKQGRDIEKLVKVIKMIINEQPLPPERENHPLHGKWEGACDCHIQGDWVLVYEIDDAERKVIFHRTGSHSDLF